MTPRGNFPLDRLDRLTVLYARPVFPEHAEQQQILEPVPNAKRLSKNALLDETEAPGHCRTARVIHRAVNCHPVQTPLAEGVVRMSARAASVMRPLALKLRATSQYPISTRRLGQSIGLKPIVPAISALVPQQHVPAFVASHLLQSPRRIQIGHVVGPTGCRIFPRHPRLKVLAVPFHHHEDLRRVSVYVHRRSSKSGRIGMRNIALFESRFRPKSGHLGTTVFSGRRPATHAPTQRGKPRTFEHHT